MLAISQRYAELGAAPVSQVSRPVESARGRNKRRSQAVAQLPD
jgi:hypothetical protein